MSLIGERYLDTQLDRGHIEGLERELASRGIVGLKRWALEIFAAGGLWWNVVWWEWCDLDERDVRLGWTYNLIFGGCITGAVAYRFGLPWAAGSALVLLVLWLWLGFSLRSGTVAAEPEA
jgi:hypothetical protein